MPISLKLFVSPFSISEPVEISADQKMGKKAVGSTVFDNTQITKLRSFIAQLVLRQQKGQKCVKAISI